MVPDHSTCCSLVWLCETTLEQVTLEQVTLEQVTLEHVTLEKVTLALEKVTLTQPPCFLLGFYSE